MVKLLQFFRFLCFDCYFCYLISTNHFIDFRLYCLYPITIDFQKNSVFYIRINDRGFRLLASIVQSVLNCIGRSENIVKFSKLLGYFSESPGVYIYAKSLKLSALSIFEYNFFFLVK